MSTTNPRLGVHVRRGTVAESLAFTKKADAAGIGTGWLTLGGPAFDSLSFIAAAVNQTERIKLGTSIVPAFIQHPVKLAAQARTIEELGAGRLRLGVGTSHGPSMGSLGIPIDRPLSRLREYVQVLRPLLQEGQVEFTGEFYDVKISTPGTLPTPVMVSALRENAYRMAGEFTDGAISWVSPLDFLVNNAKPAMIEGATKASRPVPPLIAHVNVVIGADREEARTRGRQQLAYYPMLPFYRAMFADSGWPLAEGDTEWPEDLLDHLVLSGSDEEIASELRTWLDRGVDELLINPLVGPDQDAADDRLFDILATL